MGEYKICLVPTCPNTRTNSPDKMFVYVSDDVKSRWCMENNFGFVPKNSFCCEDHLDLKEDLTNYRHWKLLNVTPILKSTANLLLNRRTSDVLHSDESEKWPKPESTISPAANSNQTFIISPLASTNAVSVDIQCKAETEDRGTTSTSAIEPDRPSTHNTEISLQCTLITDDNSVKPRKSRFSESGMKRYDLVQDKRKIKHHSSLIVKNDFNRPVQTEQSTSLTANQSTSEMQKCRHSTLQTDDPSQDQEKIVLQQPLTETRRTTKKTASVSLQSRSRLCPPEISRPSQTPIQTKARTSTSKNADDILRRSFRNTIVCETQKHPISRGSVSNDPGTGTQMRIRRPSKNTSHFSSQIDSRRSLVRSPVLSRAKGMVFSPSRLTRSKVSSHGSSSNRIVIHIPTEE